MREAMGKELARLGELHQDLLVLTADVGDSTRASYFREKYPERYFNVGIAEQHLVDFAAGLAAAGKKPVVVNFAMFLMRAWEQMRNTVARMNLDVKFFATHSGYSDSGDGSSHQSLEDIALTRVLPNFAVVVPADPIELVKALPEILAHRGPVYMRTGRDYSPPITAGLEYEFKLGKAQVLREGDDVSIVGAGVVLWDALLAAEELRKMGVGATVINVSTVKPMDEALIEYYARKTGRIVTVEEHSVIGGIGSAVSEVIVKRYPVPMRFVGASTFGRSAKSQRELLDYYGINSSSIVKAAMEVVG
ncbi:transketolase [Sulfodiicoccus acidiphilus]|uniref:2-oxoacid oxidoreductase (ferredoxin) n=2 Tax=Sulfodiicoccus acidiphilus TaxID=1670455 RepID=A0A348B104_9CREN|nr:transketolase [Sulfodiicoccus acidiphilus]GGU02476.1 transketolase [Sulfodiicoccus acidiphilus]